MFNRRSSVARKLTRMNIFVSGAALLIACVAFVGYDVSSFRKVVVEDLSTEAQIAASNSASALLFGDPQSAANTLSNFKISPNIVYGGIFLPDGRVFAEYRRDPGAAAPALTALPSDQAEVHRVTKGNITLGRTIVFQGKRLGTIWIESDTRRLGDRVRRYIGIAAIVLALSLLAALLVTPVFQGSIADPIIALAKTAQGVSTSKDYSVRVPPGLGEGEISILIQSFNEMLAQIQARDADLRKAHDELEHRVQERTAELASANKELEAFSYSVSHDLRAPLRQVDGFSSILIEQCGAELGPDARRYLQRVQDGARHMGHLVDDLLSMGRIGRQEVRRKLTDLNEIVRIVLNDLTPEIESRHIQWNIGNLPEVECDPGLIKLVFTNLLSNAVKYSRRRDTALIEVGLGETAASDPPGSPTIFVRDNGAGFDLRYADKLFGVFQRLHRADEFEGTGVGLATVQRIVQKHGGRVWAEAEVDKGATFFFTLLPGQARAAAESNHQPIEVHT